MTGKNREGFGFPDRDQLPATMPEVLTETQQNFVDFIQRHTEPTNERLRDSVDYRRGRMHVSGARQLVPVEVIELRKYTVVENEVLVDWREPFPAPYNYYSVKFSSDAAGDIANLSFTQKDGWSFVRSDAFPEHIPEIQAKLTVDTLLELEQQGALLES